MKPCHAAALALVTWHLIVPPVSTAPHAVNAAAPLSTWSIVTDFRNADRCKQGVAELRNKNGDVASLDATAKLRRFQKRHPTDPERARQRAGYASCIASDDPRFKH
jgi:hypothetical protein